MTQTFRSICAAAVLAATIAVSGGSPATGKAGAASAVAKIRAEVQAVRKALPKMKCTTKNVEDVATEGAVAKAWKDDKGRIRFLTMGLYFESGKVAEEYFFKNGKLIFAYERDQKYAVPLSAEGSFDPKKSKITETRYYFENDKLIRLQKGKTVVNDLNSKTTRSAVSDLRDRLKQWVALFVRSVKREG